MMGHDLRCVTASVLLPMKFAAHCTKQVAQTARFRGHLATTCLSIHDPVRDLDPLEGEIPWSA